MLMRPLLWLLLLSGGLVSFSLSVWSPDWTTTLALVLCVIWVATVASAFAGRVPNWGFLLIEGLFLVNVTIPAAYIATQDHVELPGFRYVAGIDDALVLAIVAQVSLAAGWFYQKGKGKAARASRIPFAGEICSPGAVLKAAGPCIVGGIAGLALFVYISGADIWAWNILLGDHTYGGFHRSADGELFKSLLGLKDWLLVGIPAMVLAVVRNGRRLTARSVFTVVVGAGCLLFVLLSGQRTSAFIVALAVLLFWQKAGSGERVFARRGRIILGIGTLGVVFIVVASMRGPTTSPAPLGAAAANQFGVGTFGTTVGLVNSVPAEQDYLLGRSYLEAVTMPVPRAVWTDKPSNIMRSVQSNFVDTRSGASVGQYGELYANFGIVGVVVGYFLLARLAAWIWLAFLATDNASIAYLLSFALPALAVLSSRGYLAGQVAGLIPLYLGVWIFSRRLFKRAGEQKGRNRTQLSRLNLA